MRLIPAFFAILLIIVGCAQLLKLQGQSAEKAAQAIETYCSNTDEDFRLGFRQAVNEKAAPHSIAITCAK